MRKAKLSHTPQVHFDHGELINLVRSHPVLYCASHAKYMDINYKNEVWNSIATKLNVPDGSICKIKWYNIRDNFRKTLKKIRSTKDPEEAKKIKPYKFTDNLNFLQKYYEEIEGRSNIDTINRPRSSYTAEEDASSGEDLDGVKDEREFLLRDDDGSLNARETGDEPHTFISLSPSFVSKPELMSPPESTSEDMFSMYGSGQARKLISHPKIYQEEIHPVDAFLSAISPTLKSLSPYQWHLAKAELFSVVQRYEAKLFEEKED